MLGGLALLLPLGVVSAASPSHPKRVVDPIFSRSPGPRDHAVKEPAPLRIRPERFLDESRMLKALPLIAPKAVVKSKSARAASVLFTGTISALTFLRQVLPSHWSLAPRAQSGDLTRGLLGCHPSLMMSCADLDPARILFVR